MAAVSNKEGKSESGGECLPRLRKGGDTDRDEHRMACSCETYGHGVCGTEYQNGCAFRVGTWWFMTKGGR